MRTSTTLLLLLVTLGLGAWLTLREAKGPPPDISGHLLFDFSDRVLQEGRPSIDIDASLIGGIDIKSSTGALALRRRKDGSWDIVKGTKDRVDPNIVRQLLEYCSKARIEDTVDDSEDGSGKSAEQAMGMEDSTAFRVLWKKDDGTKLASIRVGQTAPLGGTCYVRMDDQRARPDNYLVSPDLRTLLVRPIDAFRDPMLSKYKDRDVIRIVVNKGEGEVEFSRATADEKVGAPWVISKPLPNAMANQPAVNELLAVVCGAKITAWPDAATPAPAVPAHPEIAVSMFPAGQKRQGITFSFFPDATGGGKTAWCFDKFRKATFRVPRDLVDNLLLVENPNDFRDRNLGRINPDVVTTMQVESIYAPPVLAAKVGDKWSWRRGLEGPWEAANGERARLIIEAINKAQILDFTADSTVTPLSCGLEKPAFAVKLGSQPHQHLGNVSTLAGPSMRCLKIGIIESGQIYANFEGEPFIYRIGPELPQAFPIKLSKWRSLALPSFTLTQLRALDWISGTDPAVVLEFEPLEFKWTAKRAGEDLTAQLNRPALDSLLLKVGTLTASSWLDDDAPGANKALEKPVLVMDMKVESFEDDPAIPPVVKTYRLELAKHPSPGAPYYYARHSHRPEPFLVSNAVATSLVQSILQK